MKSKYTHVARPSFPAFQGPTYTSDLWKGNGTGIPFPPLHILPVGWVKDHTLFLELISVVPSTAQTPSQRPLAYLSMIQARFRPSSYLYLEFHLPVSH